MTEIGPDHESVIPLVFWPYLTHIAARLTVPDLAYRGLGGGQERSGQQCKLKAAFLAEYLENPVLSNLIIWPDVNLTGDPQMAPLFFRKQARAVSEGDIRLIAAVEAALTQLNANGISTGDLLGMLNHDYPDGLPGNVKNLVTMAKRGLFKHVAMQSNEIETSRYGTPMRRWKWFAPGILSPEEQDADPQPPIIDPEARLKRLAETVCLTRKLGNTFTAQRMILSAVSKAVEGMIPDDD
jgi:hypothetical protein